MVEIKINEIDQQFILLLSFLDKYSKEDNSLLSYFTYVKDKYEIFKDSSKLSRVNDLMTIESLSRAISRYSDEFSFSNQAQLELQKYLLRINELSLSIQKNNQD